MLVLLKLPVRVLCARPAKFESNFEDWKRLSELAVVVALGPDNEFVLGDKGLVGVLEKASLEVLVESPAATSKMKRTTLIIALKRGDLNRSLLNEGFELK